MKLLTFIIALGSVWLYPFPGFAQKTPIQSHKHPLPETLDTNLILPPAWAFGVLYGGCSDQQLSKIY